MNFCKQILFVSLICLSLPYAVCAESFLKTRVEKIDQPKLSQENRIKQVLRNFDVPKDIGFEKEIHVPKKLSGQMIITIQDLHCHYQAQKNIAKMLEYFTNTYGLNLISVEGGSGKIDTSFYKDLPDEKVKEQVADYFLREARINGTEYFAITTKKEIALYGAEDEKYYDKNLKAFLKALPKRDKILEDIATLENNLNILKDRIYNKRLKELDDHIVAYQNGSLPFEDYMLYIAEHYTDEKLKSEFTQVPNLVDSIRLKRKLDLDKISQQREKMIEYLTENLNRYETEDFLKITLEFKAKTIEQLDYHNTIKSLYDQMDAKTKSLDRAWPQLSKYIEYINKFETLDEFIMFQEIDKLVERVKNMLYTSYTQKNLDNYLNRMRLARKLFSTKLITRDLPAMERYKGEFKSRNLAKFIRKEAKRLKLELIIPRNLDDMEKTMPLLEDFYYFAAKRNDVLAQNTINGMVAEKENIGILVTGGFHTDGITDYFKDRRICYVVVAPVVDEISNDDTKYINALQGKKTPFELQLEREEKLAEEPENVSISE